MKPTAEQNSPQSFVKRLKAAAQKTILPVMIVSGLNPFASAQTPQQRGNISTPSSRAAIANPSTLDRQVPSRVFRETLTNSLRSEMCYQSSQWPCSAELGQRAAELANFLLQNRFSGLRQANFNSSQNIMRFTQYMATAALQSSTNSSIDAEAFQAIVNRTGLPTSINQSQTRPMQQSRATIEAQRRQRIARLTANASAAERNARTAMARLDAAQLETLRRLLTSYDGSAQDTVAAGGSEAAQEVGRQTAYDEANRPLEAEQRRQLDETFDTAPQGSQEGDSQPAPATQTQALPQ